MGLRTFYIAFLGFCISTAGYSQSINTTFGKNRVQYHDDFNRWDKYETENFVTFWYGKARKIAHATIQLAELDHSDIQGIIEHKLKEKLEIVVYADLSDLKQSNIGNEEAFHNADNQTKIIGNKMFVYFNGDHNHLRKQIREGIAGVYLNSLLYGGSIQEQVQSALLLKLPAWFNEGLVSYCGNRWSSDIEDEVRDILNHKAKKYAEFDKFSVDKPKLAGHSLWYYLDQMYGKSVIANLIYLTRINRNFEESFYYILGESFEQIKEDWRTYYFEGLHIDLDSDLDLPQNTIPIRNKRNYKIPLTTLSPSGDSMIYVLNDKGKYLVYLYDFTSQKSEKIHKGGTKNIFQETDYNYPLVAWHPNGREISIIYERRDVKYIKAISLQNGEDKTQEIPGNFQRIYSFDYTSDVEYMFNASVDGYSDLFLYSAKGRSTKRLTTDYHDDLDAKICTYKNQKGILFSSTRTNETLIAEELDTILPVGNYDLYFLSLEDRDNLELTCITETKDISERQAFVIEQDAIVYTESQQGLNERYILQDGKTYLNSDEQRSIETHSANAKSNSYVYTIQMHQKNILCKSKLDINQEYSKESKKVDPQSSDEFIPIFKLEEEIPEGIKFQSKFDDPPTLDPMRQVDNVQATTGFEKYFSNYFSESVQDGRRIIKFVPMRASAARLRFKWFDIKTRVDNSVLFEGLESYTEQDPTLSNQATGILFNTEVKDIFEDYKVEAGIRIPTTFNGSEIYMFFDNDKKLFDHRFALYRKSTTNVEDANFFPIIRSRRHALLGLYRIKYPFDVYRSLALTTSLRFDKFFFLSSETASLNSPFDREKRLSAKLEYIYDNSYEAYINIYKGARYKVYLEAINEFDLDVTDGFDFDISNGFTTILGFDARYYQPIYKHAIIAFRGAGATSFGNKKMLYYVGGTEGSFSRKFDNSVPVPNDRDFAYKVLAPHLRGFDHNIRNGNNYLLGNIELRVPVLHTMGLKNVKISFLRNLQVVGFLDGGLAWHGLSPFDEGNLINNVTLERPPTILVNVQYFRDPLVMGYGFGFRSTLLGYFLKLDFAWGVETRSVQDRKVYLSMGKDF